MTPAILIPRFNLQVSDMTELSDFEEIALFNRVYQRVCADRPWEFLKTNATGSISADTTGSYITIPTDFAYFIENKLATDNTVAYQGNAEPTVIFIVENGVYKPYQVVNFSDRRQYTNKGGYAYLDLGQGKIRFTTTPAGTTYDFDYIKVPATVTISDTIIIPDRFADIIVFGMALENDILELSPKATSYAPENKVMYDKYLLDMQYWNAQLQLN